MVYAIVSATKVRLSYFEYDTTLLNTRLFCLKISIQLAGCGYGILGSKGGSDGEFIFVEGGVQMKVSKRVSTVGSQLVELVGIVGGLFLLKVSVFLIEELAVLC